MNDWIETSSKLPYHGQRVWVLFPSGFEYPAMSVSGIGQSIVFISHRPEIEFREQPTRWRTRE